MKTKHDFVSLQHASQSYSRQILIVALRNFQTRTFSLLVSSSILINSRVSLPFASICFFSEWIICKNLISFKKATEFVSQQKILFPYSHKLPGLSILSL